MKLYDLRTDSRKTPLGTDERSPAFSWKIASDRQDTFQESYHIIVYSPEETVWDSGVVHDRQSLYLVYQGSPLQPQTRYTVRVAVTDCHGEADTEETWFETGLMSPENWQASWITHSGEDDREACAVFRKQFSLSGDIKQARLYISSLGIYEFKINGQRTTEACFTPGWTSYRHRLQYQTYDITAALFREAPPDNNPDNSLEDFRENTLEVTIGNGWYKGILGFDRKRNHYGKRTALIAQIMLCYEDGRRETIVTDETWLNTTGEKKYSDIYNGEIIDHTFCPPPALPSVKYEYTKQILTAQENEPVCVVQRIPAKQAIVSPKGEFILDFGQNLTGVVEAKLRCREGSRVTLYHGEALDEKGCFFNANLRTAKAADTFICRGEEELFCPSFTYHGFRYVKVEGLDAAPEPEDFTACVMHSGLEQTGFFCCSDEKVNRLWRNIDWTMRSNYFDIPTDCPQRDERFGYTGDAQIFLSTAAFLKDTAAFFRKWLRDVKQENTLEYGVPMAVPNILGNSAGIAIWQDAAAVVPWTIYQVYGDRRILEEQYDSIKCCVEYSRSRTGQDGLLHTGQQLGDWVALDMERGPVRPLPEGILNLELREKCGATDLYFIANAYYLYSISLLIKAAEVLEKQKDAADYGRLYQEVLHSFRKEYITQTGRLISETQTGCALVLQLGLAEEKDRKQVLEALKNNIKQHKNHLTTGFAGTQFLCRVLSDNGEHETAGKIFLQEDCPSWLYSVNLGATTVWELWDGVNPDGSFNPFEMNSLNQYALASIGDWMHRNLGGLSSLAPGYKKSRIAPRLITGIPEVEASLETVYGKLSCSISCRKGKYRIDIQVPPNTTALVSLPEREEFRVGSGRYHYEYETKASFVKKRFSMDSTLGAILAEPLGSEMLHRLAPELCENELFMQFAAERTLEEISAMLPPESMTLFTAVMDRLNQTEGEENINEADKME